MNFTIAKVTVSKVAGKGSGGDYFQQGKEHWLIGSLIANPMSGHERYKASRTSWGIDVLGSLVVEIETESGHCGIATGFGGAPGAWLIQHHFQRFLIGQDARNRNLIWDQLYRASLPYGQTGLPIAAISAVDLALWDLLGKLRGEPVYNLIGGLSRSELTFYCTGPKADAIRDMGFWGAKVPLPHGHFDGIDGLRANVEFLNAQRQSVGPEFPLMVDCYMALTPTYAIELAEACKHLNINWWEEVLHPGDTEGYRQIRQAHPTLKFTTGEHTYSRYGFRRLIEERTIDILQPDVMWMGGLTELLRIAAHAGTYDIPIIPHGSGPYSYHFIASQNAAPNCEYVTSAPDGRSIRPVFGNLFTGEPTPENGLLKLPDRPGFGMELSSRGMLEQFE
ncbi:MAG: L-rhamnonate dehydratase [Geminicoccaceae bacterium]|nr:L-rhamnonate dehydratase [Geminicoccaceae bacterium]